MQAQTSILIGIITALLVFSTITQAQAQQEETTVTNDAAQNFNYTPDQCNEWVAAAIDIQSATTETEGLSQSEFITFLASIPQLDPYFNLFSVEDATGNSASVTFANLPFEVQLAYPTLACWCQELGDGEDCCKGDNNPRINVSALVEENPSEVAMAYRQDFCAFVGLVVKELEKEVVDETIVVTFTTTSATSASETTTSTTSASSGSDGTQSSSSPSIVDTATTTTTTNPTTSADPIAFTIIGSVIDYSTYPLQNDSNSNLFDAPTTAKDIMANSESKKGIIGQLIQGFTALSLEMLAECPVLEVLLEKEEEEMKRASVANSSGEVEQQSSILAPGILGKLEDTLVDDIACPDGLTYAPKDASCIKFTITMKPSEGLSQYDQVRSCLESNIKNAIDNGELYNIVKDISTNDDKITGLGIPGAGIDYIIGEREGTGDVDGSTTTDETAPAGLTGGYIFLIVVALFAIPIILFAVTRYREKQAEEMARVREFAGEPAASNDVDGLDVENPATAPAVVDDGANEGEGKETNAAAAAAAGDDDDESSAPSVWSESRGSQAEMVDEENATPSNAMMGSSLAAMGVASAVATNLYEKKNAGSNDKEEEEKQVGNEEKQDLESIKSEITSLVAKTAPGKTAEELLNAYAGKEEELLSHLRRLERETSR